MHVHAIAGPKYDDINPVWEFGKGRFASVLYDGLPQNWDFNWTTFSAKGIDTCKEGQNEDSCIELPLCGWAFHPRSACQEIVILPSLKQNANLGGRPRHISSLWPLQLLLLHPLLSFFLLSPYTHYIS